MSYADDATHRLRDRVVVGYGYDAPQEEWGSSAGYSDESPGSVHVGGATVGFTAPVVIYDRMKAIDASARALDRDIARNVAKTDATANFRAAWAEWLKRWTAFFDRTMSLSQRLLGTPFRSDAVRDEANQFALELDRFVETYRRQPSPDGDEVPEPTLPLTPGPIPTRPEPGGGLPIPPVTIWSAIPWWGYALGVAFLGALGYSFYKAAEHAKKREEQLFNELPRMMGWRDQTPGAPVVVNVAPPPAPAAPAPADASQKPPGT